MDCSRIQENASHNKLNYKLSPLTSAGTLSQFQQNAFIEDIIIIEESFDNAPSINKNNIFKTFSIEEKPSTKLKELQNIEKQIMEYFDRKGLRAGHPQQLKKQYNRKLHKRVSMMVEVSEVVCQKASEGSSLLQRRLKKKMTINL